MAAGNGFLTARPDARYTTNQVGVNVNEAWPQKFTLAGTGTKEVSEIGVWSELAGTVRMAIFEDDAANSCPGAMVANSDIEVTLSAGQGIYYSTYGTKPQLTGGTIYWIALFSGSATAVYPDMVATGGTMVHISAALTYPTWPTDTQWHTFDVGTQDASFYAIYADAAATGQFARPAADRTDGNWLNSAGTPDNVDLFSYIDETSASDADYIRSGASPSSDTCTIDLSSIATPQAGTVTLRVRARFV